jgi:hypothetical protein
VSKAKHTPGPWRAIDYPGADKVFAGDFHICDIRGWGYLTAVQKLSDEEAIKVQDANARLIAAAPELLAALKGILTLMQSGRLRPNTSADPHPYPDVRLTPFVEAEGAAIHAIAKAEGTVCTRD